MFQVKATVIGFLGDEEKYPCHFQHQIGDTFIYDGEKFIGRICPSVTRLLIPAMMPLHAAGPREMPPAGYYYPFWYAPISRKDPGLKKYDGLGFRNVLETSAEPDYHMANLAPKGSYQWPPIDERAVARESSTVVCPDIRTAMVIKAEAFDLSEKGYDVPYFRRQMTILDRVLKAEGIPVNEIINQFSREEIEGIYPALSPILITCLNQELELVGLLKLIDGKAFVTDKGREKLDGFKKGLSAEEKKALNL